MSGRIREATPKVAPPTTRLLQHSIVVSKHRSCMANRNRVRSLNTNLWGKEGLGFPGSLMCTDRIHSLQTYQAHACMDDFTPIMRMNWASQKQFSWRIAWVSTRDFDFDHVYNHAEQRIIYICVHGLLSKSLFEKHTELYCVKPVAVHAVRIEVPTLTLQNELHFMPKWHPKAFGMPFSSMITANLRWDDGTQFDTNLRILIAGIAKFQLILKGFHRLPIFFCWTSYVLSHVSQSNP